MQAQHTNMHANMTCAHTCQTCVYNLDIWSNIPQCPWQVGSGSTICPLHLFPSGLGFSATSRSFPKVHAGGKSPCGLIHELWSLGCSLLFVVSPGTTLVISYLVWPVALPGINIFKEEKNAGVAHAFHACILCMHVSILQIHICMLCVHMSCWHVVHPC